MAAIGDLLSKNLIKTLINSSIKVGNVYRMKLGKEEKITPKNPQDDSRNKYFIIVGKDKAGNALGFVLINTNINVNLPDSIKDLHYPINPSKYPFLETKRFVDCSELKIIYKDKFDSLFDSSKEKGQIKEDDLELIISALQSSPKVTPKQLKTFGL